MTLSINPSARASSTPRCGYFPPSRYFPDVPACRFLGEVVLSGRELVENLRLTACVLVVAAVLCADQATKASAAARGLVAANPSYALGVVGGSATILIVGALVVLVAFLAFAAYA